MKKELSFNRDQFFQLLTKRLDFWIEEEEKTRFKEQYPLLVAKLDETEFKLDEDEYFAVRSDIVKAVLAANTDFNDYIKKNYQAELNHSRKDLFPRGWMLKDNKIKDVIDRCERFLPIINHLHNRNRYARGEDLKKMLIEIAEITGNKKIEPVRVGAMYISYFIGNAEFYDEFHNSTDIPVATIKKHISAYIKIGNVKKCFDGGSKGTVYADGWFQQNKDNRLQKYSFLVQTKEIREGLRTLPALVI